MSPSLRMCRRRGIRLAEIGTHGVEGYFPAPKVRRMGASCFAKCGGRPFRTLCCSGAEHMVSTNWMRYTAKGRGLAPNDISSRWAGGVQRRRLVCPAHIRHNSGLGSTSPPTQKLRTRVIGRLGASGVVDHRRRKEGRRRDVSTPCLNDDVAALLIRRGCGLNSTAICAVIVMLCTIIEFGHWTACTSRHRPIHVSRALRLRIQLVFRTARSHIQYTFIIIGSSTFNALRCTASNFSHALPACRCQWRWSMDGQGAAKVLRRLGHVEPCALGSFFLSSTSALSEEDEEISSLTA